MSARFKLFTDGGGNYHFELRAANGETVAASQNYRSVSDALSGIAAVRTAAADAEVPNADDVEQIDSGIHMHF